MNKLKSLLNNHRLPLAKKSFAQNEDEFQSKTRSINYLIACENQTAFWSGPHLIMMLF